MVTVESEVESHAFWRRCQIDIRQMPLNTPLLLSLTTKDIIYPEPEGSIIYLSRNDQLQIDCPGAGSILVNGTTITEITTITCVSGSYFEIAGYLVDIATVVCSSRVRSNAYYTGNTCWRIGKEIEVGFDIQDGRFLQQYTTCFDDILRNALYSRYILTRQIGEAITGGTSPTWQEDDFYNLDARVNNIYPNVAQRPAINRQLGLDEDDITYVRPTGHYYLARGHLTARTDFKYNAQQMSTFHYVNSAPQWQTFNGYNWYYFERNLRIYASTNFVDLEVYTGTYGITTLPHAVTGEDVELYLYFDDNNNKALPIPELFWKVAYDPLNRAGIAVLGINNPYQSNITRSIICNDVADKLDWLTFDRTIVERGFMYACTVDDF
ncbi:hypothetical protein NQ317_014324 [Molorchus minor]|uniref:DNA/RNA non-specific endonuclease domain-containing protein n=1 Tax=Molorchus minor TaxID=1323400 RepID=A0ABQ9JZ16_9CUCU|nr:hypothetical protein NQ317_014324 [Molorchus minor]